MRSLADDPTQETLDYFEDVIQSGLRTGNGELLFEITGPEPELGFKEDELAKAASLVETIAKKLNCEFSTVAETKGKQGKIRHILLR